MKDFSDILNHLQSLVTIIKRYAVILLVAAFAVACGYVITLTNSLVQQEPDQAAVNEQLKTVPRPKITDQAAARMQQLESQNVDIKAIFDNARQNPFNE